MLRITLVAAGLVVALAACGTRANPDFCCSDLASCRSSGTDVQPVTCDDPVKSFCDDQGQYGAPRTCIADPISNECDAPADCTNPDRPFCIGNHCVQCEDGLTCDNPAPACNPTTHLCGPCMGPADCAGELAGTQCLAGACVECAGAADCTSVAEPVCEPSDHTCRGCRVDDECASAVCDRSAGTCTAEADVLYVAAGATGTTCTKAAPCGTIGAALVLAGTSRTIKIGPGTYTEALIVNTARTIRFHGSGARVTGGTVVSAPGSNVHVFAVSGGATVTIDDLVVTNANGVSAPNGIRCTDATIAVRRTLVDTNPGGGIGITRCNFELTNDIITRNGGPSSLFGGVSLSELLAGTSASFQFNTVARNAAPAGSVAGVACNQINITIGLDSSIIYDNGAAGDPEYGPAGQCMPHHSVLGDGSVPATNVNTNPGFVSLADAHLVATSPVAGLADATATLDHDLDGDLRPQGGARDPGADEIAP